MSRGSIPCAEIRREARAHALQPFIGFASQPLHRLLHLSASKQLSFMNILNRLMLLDMSSDSKSYENM